MGRGLSIPKHCESNTTADFRRMFAAAPESVRRKARTAYRLFEDDPHHPSLRFKKVHPSQPIYSARIDRGWRAVGVIDEGTIIWFWIGPHDAYELLLQST